MLVKNWDIYFTIIAHVVASRSKDPSTQHGAVIVDDKKRIIATGYNGPPMQANDDEVPLTRPEKYTYFIHAEMNALMFAKRDLTNCTIYITGYPCLDCLKHIAQSGIKRIVCSNRTSKMLDKDYEYVLRNRCKQFGIELSIIESFLILKDIDDMYNFLRGMYE